ncbi:inosine/xanthosine triphosphatase [Natrarchaeobius sp. A-rgal3]|uniref:inosine/xanthosine triphosphatase n=1 Tax=Natrarchaeobius versutus TaxID=1679078 RepID=UPI00351036C9
MHVVVGSENPVKREATTRALERFGPVVRTVSVDSGVDEQPRSVAETITGAENRARRALEACEADYGVGLEGGAARFENAPGLFLIMWAAVTDGDRLERASGPSIRLPDPVTERIAAGEELGPVMDDVLGTDGIAEGEGAVGALTGGVVDRSDALASAVTCAFGPFRADQYRDS